MGEREDEGPSGQLGMGLVTLIMKGGWSWLWLAHGSCFFKGLQHICAVGGVLRSGCPVLCQQRGIPTRLSTGSPLPRESPVEMKSWLAMLSPGR